MKQITFKVNGKNRVVYTNNVENTKELLKLVYKIKG